jgi:hypothetical protein
MAIRMTKKIMKKKATHHDDVLVNMKLLFETIGVQGDVEHVYRIARLSKPSATMSVTQANCEAVPMLPREKLRQLNPREREHSCHKSGTLSIVVLTRRREIADEFEYHLKYVLGRSPKER